MSQVITQLKIFAWLYIFCSICALFILAILFIQGRLHFYFNNVNCAVECFTNPLDQTISNVVELHKDYTAYRKKHIIMQNENDKQAKQLANITEEKKNLDKKLEEAEKDRDSFKKKLDAYKE